MKPSQKNKLGRVDLEITSMGLGSVALGNLFGAIPNGQADEVVQKAWDSGIRFFDTAPLYGHGMAEYRFGASLRLKSRDDYVLSSKVGRLLRPAPRSKVDFGAWIDVPSFELVYDYTYDGTMRAFEDSLQRLGLERIDISFIHDIDVANRGDEQPEVFRQAMDGCWKALERLRSEGVVSAIGVGVNEWEVCEAALRERDFDVFLLAGRYTLLEQGALKSFLPFCVDRNVAVVVGGGFNSGILATGAIEGARHNYGPAAPEVMARVKEIEDVCGEYGVPIQAAAMQFVIAHPAVASLVIGVRNASQLDQNIDLFEQPIPAEFWSAMKGKGLLREDAPTP